MGEIMREAQFSLAEANFAAGDFRFKLAFELEKLHLKHYTDFYS